MMSSEREFSEEENAVFLAGHDTDSDSGADSKKMDGNRSNGRSNQLSQLTLGNVTTIMRQGKDVTKTDDNEKVIILFDLNGVLVRHAFDGHAHSHDIRPGVEHLPRLTEAGYRLGIYSSATRRTVQRALDKLSKEVGTDLFDVILSREHCVLAKDLSKGVVTLRKDGKPWDTVKPLGRYFKDLGKVILVDDSPHKSLPSEKANMLVVPEWEGLSTLQGREDGAIQTLVEGLVELAASHESTNGSDIDVRQQHVVKAKEWFMVESTAVQAVPTHVQTPLEHLILATIESFGPMDGVTVFDINLLLHHLFPTAFMTIMQGSAKSTVSNLKREGLLETYSSNQNILHGQQYVISENGISDGKLVSLIPTKEKVMELEERCNNSRSSSANVAQPRHKEDELLVEEADAGARDLVLYAVSFLQRRGGVPRDYVDKKVVDDLHAEFSRVVQQTETAQLLPTETTTTANLPGFKRPALRKKVHEAQDACAARGLLKVMDYGIENLPPSLVKLKALHSLQLSPLSELLSSTVVEMASKFFRFPAETVRRQPLPSQPQQLLEVFEDRGNSREPTTLPPMATATGTAEQQQSVGTKRERDEFNEEISPESPKRTRLHHEVATFAGLAAPTQTEIYALHDAVSAVDAAARSLWPTARTMLFGSQPSGLALPGGDLDLVILGVGPHASAASGFALPQRRKLTEHLRRLLDALHRQGTILSNTRIIDARVPIIKCDWSPRSDKEQANGSTGSLRLPLDISLGVANGAAAVGFLRRQVIAVPPLRPLTLIIKALLRDKGHNEVFTGGLGSYAVVNMVLAYLMQQGYSPDLSDQDTSQLAGQSLTGKDALAVTQKFLEKLAAQATSFQVDMQVDAQIQAEAKGGNKKKVKTDSEKKVEEDLGVLLWGFLEWFGRKFDYNRKAISVRGGGVVPKMSFWRVPQKPWLLTVEDPQEQGKDICAAFSNVVQVRNLFADAADLLAEASELKQADPEVAAKTKTKAKTITKAEEIASDSDPLPLLSLLVDVQGAIGRGSIGQAARQAFEERAAAVREEVIRRRTPKPFFGEKYSNTFRNKFGTKIDTCDDGDGDYVHRLGVQQKFFPKRSPNNSRGTKHSRAVEAQWRNKAGQYGAHGDDGQNGMEGRDHENKGKGKARGKGKGKMKVKAKIKKSKAKRGGGGGEVPGGRRTTGGGSRGGKNPYVWRRTAS